MGISGADPDMAHRVDDLLLPIVKGVGSERAYEILTESLQTLGGSGFVVDYPLEQYIRDAKIDSVYESTNGAKRRKITVYGSQTRWLTTSEISDQRLNYMPLTWRDCKTNCERGSHSLTDAAELMAKELLKMATDDSVVAGSTAKPI